MRSLSLRFLVAFSILLVPAFAFASNVTVSGTTTFAALDGGPDDADHTVNGIFTVNGDLTVNGTINCNDDGPGNNSACAMRFAVSGNMVMNAGSALYAENRKGGGSGGDITINAGGGVTLHGPFSTLAGAVISSSALGSSHVNAGNITVSAAGPVSFESGTVVSAASKGDASGVISVTAGGAISVSGLVASGPTSTLLSTRLTGDVLAKGSGHQSGGAITIRSTSVFDPAVTLDSNATIVSQGEVDAAGPMIVEGCGIIVRGLVVALTGDGSATRVALRSGKEILIDASDLGVTGATTGKLGHVRSDSGSDSAGAKKVDLFAGDAIQVLGPNPALSTIYAVSSTPNGKGEQGGTITAISLKDSVTGSGRVFLAGQDSDSNNGGTIAISSMGSLNLDHGYLSAIGDATKLKKDSSGGHITARSYSGNVVWTSGQGDVRPVGSGASGVAAQGTIALTACGTVSISGTTFPSNGPIAGVFPTIVTGSCSPAAPSLPAGEPALPICCNVITITNPAVTSGPAGVAFSQTFTQTGAIGTATFSLASGTLPSGLTLATNGTLSGTPTVTGTFPITVKVTDSQGCTGVGPTYNLQIVCPTITVTNPGVSSGVAAAPFSQTFTQSGGVGATTFSLASGTLPAGLSLSSSGTLSGTPTQTGTFPITVKATDANGCTGTGATYTLTITCQTITVTNPAVSSGVAGSPFSQTFTQSGGIGTTTFSIASGTLPAGLSLAANGTLAGTPTQTGSFTITVKATDSNGCSGTGASYTLTIACQTITVTNPAVTTGVAGSSFSQTFTQSGAIGTATFTLASGTLPAGLSLSSSGVLSGTPTQVGTFPITVKVTDSNGCSGTGATYNLTISCQTITVAPPAVNSGVAGSPFSQTFTQSGAIGTATFTLTSGTLPSGLGFSSAGVLSGTPMQTGTFPITVKVTDSNGCSGTVSYTLTIVCQTITVTPPSVNSGVAAAPFSQTFTESGAIGTANFTTSSTLPTGLSLSTTGILSGTPTQTGTFPITVTVTDSNGCTGSASYTLTITCQTITVTPPSVNTGVAGTAFSQLFTQSDAIGTATFSLASGALPAGMSLAADGTLSGTPQQVGSFPITVTATDSNGCTGTSATYTLTISCQTITVTHPAVMSGTVNTPFSQQYTQTGGIGAVTFSLTTGTLPAGMSLAADGTLSGTPTQSGTFPITVTATDSNGCTGSDSFTLTIACQTITVTNPAVTSGTVGSPFSQTFTQSGAEGTATFTTASTLPTGFTLSAAGVLSGTTQQHGTFPIVVTVTDSNGCTGTGATYSLVISCQTITVTNPANASGTVASPFSELFSQSGALGGATFTTMSTLPAGLTLSAAGLLSGTPSQSGTFPIVVKVTDGNGCIGIGPTYTLIIACNVITVNNPGNSTGTAGTAFTATFTQSGGNGTITWSETGALPTGISLNPSTGVLSGTTSQTGSFPIAVTATDSNGCHGTGSTYTLVIGCQTITVTNPGQTSAQAGTPFNATFTATGILGTATWSETGALPTGISLNSSTGALSGTPTQIGTFPITVQATDSNGCFGTSSYTLTVTCPTITVTRTGGGSFPAATFNVGYPAGNTFTATGGSGNYHWAFQSGTQPPGINLTIAAGSLSGIPSATGTFSMTVIATDQSTGCTGQATFAFTIKPNVANDSYSNLVNNTEAYVTGGATTAPATPAVQLSGTIVSNDTPAAGVTVDASSVGTFSTTQGGSVTIAADGTFKYTPPVTASPLSSDTFTYTGTSNTGTVPSFANYAASTGPSTATGTVTLNLANRVWYVKNDVGGGGNGQSQAPFSSLGLAASASTPNDIIFVYRGDGTANGQSSGIILKNGQLLIGQGVSLIVNGNLLVAAGTAPLIGNGFGNVVTLAIGNSVEGLTINATTGAGILSAGITSGTTTVSSVTVSASGVNNGVSLSSNTGATFNFSGIAITSATGTGLLATGGGTVNATGAGNTIAATGGTALNVTNTSIGASGLTFASIAATGGTSGIVLNNTGTSGGLTVTGDGPSDPANATRGNTTAKQGGGTITIGSGGTIQNTTLSGILLTNTSSVSLTSMKILNAGGAAVNTGNNGITATTVNGLVLDNVLITGSTGNSGLRGTTVTNLQMQHANINGNGTVAGTEVNRNWNVRLDDLAGTCGSTCNWQNSLFFNSRSNVVGLNQGVSVTNVNFNATITNCEFRDNTTGHTSPGNDAFILSAFNSAVTNLTVTGSTFKNVEVGGFQYNGNDNSGGTVNVRNSVFELNGSDVLLAHGGGSGGNATLNFDVSGNTMRQLLSPNSSVSVNVFLGGLSGAGSLMSGTIKNNTIGNAGVTNSGSVVGDGIDVNATGAGTITATVTGNTVHQIQFGDAFFTLADNGSGKLNLFVHSNNFNTDGTAGNSLAGIDLISGAGSDTSAMCVDMALNVANGDAFYQGATVSTFGGVGATIKLLGLNATFNNDANAIANFIGSSSLTTPPGVNSSVNPTPTVGGGAVTITGGGTIVGTASCGSFPP